MAEWLVGKSPHDVEMVQEADSVWQRQSDAGLVVLRVHDSGAVEGLWTGEIPRVAVEAHRRELEACTYLIIRFPEGANGLAG